LTVSHIPESISLLSSETIYIGKDKSVISLFMQIYNSVYAYNVYKYNIVLSFQSSFPLSNMEDLF